MQVCFIFIIFSYFSKNVQQQLLYKTTVILFLITVKYRGKCMFETVCIPFNETRGLC